MRRRPSSPCHRPTHPRPPRSRTAAHTPHFLSRCAEEYDEKKQKYKDLADQKKKLDDKLKPLEDLKKDSAGLVKMAQQELEKKNKDKGAASTKADELTEEIEEKRAALKRVETELQKVRKEREKVEAGVHRTVPRAPSLPPARRGPNPGDGRGWAPRRRLTRAAATLAQTSRRTRTTSR